MNPRTMPVPRLPRRSRAGLTLVFLLGFSVLLPSGIDAADPSTAPEAAATPAHTMSPSEAACDSVADLRLIVEFLRETDVSEDGWLPIFVGVVAALGEARQLVGSLDETYRPLLDDLIASLQGLRATIEGLEGMGTTGAQIAVIGESITDIGNAMDALSVRLRTPCPTAAPEDATIAAD